MPRIDTGAVRAFLLAVCMVCAIPSRAFAQQTPLVACDEDALEATELIGLTRLPHQDYFELVSEHQQFNREYDNIFQKLYEDRQWFPSVMARGGTKTSLRGVSRCDERGALSGGGSLSDYGLSLRMEHRQSDSSLMLTGVGRTDFFLWNYEGTEQYNTGVVKWSGGARLQLSPWFAAQYVRARNRSFYTDKPTVASRLNATPEILDYHVVSLEVPAFGLAGGLLFGDDVGSVRFDRLSIEQLPLGRRFLLSASGEMMRYEQRGKGVAKLEYLLGEDAYERQFSSAFESNLSAEVGIETHSLNFRHARVGVDIMMLDNRLSGVYPDRGDIGARIGQRLHGSLFHGQIIEETVGRRWAPGVMYETYVQMQSGYIFYTMDFGMGINRPEMLELNPHSIHAGEINLKMNISSKF